MLSDLYKTPNPVLERIIINTISSGKQVGSLAHLTECLVFLGSLVDFALHHPGVGAIN